MLLWFFFNFDICIFIFVYFGVVGVVVVVSNFVLLFCFILLNVENVFWCIGMDLGIMYLKCVYRFYVNFCEI